ncbi:MAG: bifunctional DNA primase/polymerase [Anaerolineae bacterium]|nr:bifunctional DNA primase/polymerase [Anaerolineae bacterium]
MSEILSAALKYLECGFSLFPLAYQTKDPKRTLLPKIEHPKRGLIPSWQPFQKERPTEKQIKSWFNFTQLNIALVMGEVSGNVFALDFDQEQAYFDWVKEHAQLSPEHTATAETGHGFHVLARMPGPLPRSWKILFRGIHIGETRGEGGYIAVWPSIHPSGRQYSWITPPWEGIAEISSLADVGITRAVETPAARAAGEIRPQNGRHPLPPRTRAFMASGHLGQSARGVNDELYQAAIQHAAAGYSEQETLEALMPVALKFYVGTGAGNTEGQAERTIKSGWKGGQGKEPITLGQPGALDRASSGPNGHAVETPPPPDPALASDEGGPNDIQIPPGVTLALQKPEKGLKAAYSLKNGEMVYTTYKQVKDDIIALEKIIPFYGQVTQKLTLFDEATQTVIYTIEGKKDGKPYTAEITAVDFADGNRLYSRLLNYLPGKPPPIDPPLITRLATAIAALTPAEEMKEVKAITSTGWTPDGKAFVLPGGAIGQSDYQCKLDAELAKEFAAFGFRRNTPEENKIAWAGLMALNEIYQHDVIYTTLAHAFLPPLLRWLGDEARYLYHIHADTGSFKTELAKLLMALYGPVGSAALTYKWSGTPYGAEARAYALKDCLMLIDDLKPGTITNDALPKWVAFVQAAVDAQGRKRATITGKAAASLPPRALLLSTGEAVPEAGEASYSARMLLGQLASQPTGVRNTKLDEIKATAPLFSGLMAAYIQWLLDGDGRGSLAKFKEFQALQFQTEHTRLSNNYAANSTGAAMLAKFCEATGLMTVEQAESFQARHGLAIFNIVGKTGEKVKSERYSWKFLAALRDTIATGYAAVSAVICDRRVGWQDDTYLYLLGGSFEIVNQWLRASGQAPINISKAELRKQLFQDQLSYCTKAREEGGWFDVQVHDPATKTRILVVALYLDKFNAPDDPEAQ